MPCCLGLGHRLVKLLHQHGADDAPQREDRAALLGGAKLSLPLEDRPCYVQAYPHLQAQT